MRIIKGAYSRDLHRNVNDIAVAQTLSNLLGSLRRMLRNLSPRGMAQGYARDLSATLCTLVGLELITVMVMMTMTMIMTT